MNSLPIPVSNLEFKNNVSIQFNSILDGFNEFKNFTLDGNLVENSELSLINFICDVFKQNNNECYVDFYINKIDKSEKDNLLNLIDKEHKSLLQQIIDMNHDDVYYKITDIRLIPFFTKLNTRELFFVTFYFTKKPITIWGNYNFKFPCFFNNSHMFNYFYNIAKHSNLIKIQQY
ncbi:hypothetical protein [Clostridium butyricum]